MIGWQCAERRLPPHCPQLVRSLVHNGRRGGGRILRVERRQQDAFASCVHQRLDSLGDRGRAVAHGPVDRYVVAQTRLHRFGLLAGDHRERRALLAPDLTIGMRAFLRTRVEDNPAQNGLPSDSRDFDHAPVGKEFREIAFDRALLGRVGRSEIDDQDTYPTRFHGRMVCGKLLVLPGHRPSDSKGRRRKRTPVAE